MNSPGWRVPSRHPGSNAPHAPTLKGSNRNGSVEGCRSLVQVGKGQAGGQPLPVVAVGLIPHIYRRASFTHRATPQ